MHDSGAAEVRFLSDFRYFTALFIYVFPSNSLLPMLICLFYSHHRLPKQLGERVLGGKDREDRRIVETNWSTVVTSEYCRN